MIPKPFLVHALSPLHPGTGQAADVIDLPIARMRATGIPFIPGSSIKGVLRDVRKPESGDHSRWTAVFGPETSSAHEHSGAIVVSDARLLALPVRSFRGTFAFVTSPLLLRLAIRDLGADWPSVPAVQDTRCLVTSNSRLSQTTNDRTVVYLEDLDLPCTMDPDVTAWADKLAGYIDPENPTYLTSRFAVVDDETMTFLWETATQVDTRIRINPDTGTVAKGQLWTEESLPSETLLVGVLGADRSRKAGVVMEPSEVIDFALPAAETLQFGGKASVGRGRSRVIRI